MNRRNLLKSLSVATVAGWSGWGLHSFGQSPVQKGGSTSSDSSGSGSTGTGSTGST